MTVSVVQSNIISTGDTDQCTKQIKIFLTKYTLSCISATIAETITYPLDITKTRLQIQGELEKKDALRKHHGMFRTALNIATHEGFTSLWSGVTPAIYRHIIYSGFRLVLYENLRDQIQKDKTVDLPLWEMVLIGSLTGATAQFLASPTDLVKVIMQADGKRRLEGKKPRIKNVNQAFRELYSKGGMTGLWRGAVVNMQRAALVNLGDLTTYDFVKKCLMHEFHFHDNFVTHTMSSICSGLVAATMSTPADVIKTRIMNQPTDNFGKGLIYKSSIHCLTVTFKNEGLNGLYKGWLPTWMRMAPWSLTFWLTYEQIRRFSGLSGF